MQVALQSAVGAGMLVVLISLALSSTAEHPGDERSYESILSRSIDLEASGDLPGALAILEAEQERFPQDYLFQLRRAWLFYQTQSFHEAEELYQRAIELSGGSFDARLGLAWTRLELGESSEAAQEFEALLEEAPGHAGAARGFALARSLRPQRWSLSFVGTGHHYVAHSAKENAGGLAVGLRLRPFLPVRTEALFRGTYFPASGPGRGANAYDAFLQHELYLSAGYDQRALRVLGHFARVTDESGAELSTTCAGASIGLAWVGRLELSGTISLYEDLEVFRGALSWWLPVVPHLAIQPAAALQISGGTALGNGALTLSVYGEDAAVWLQAKAGEELRPYYLEQPSVFNLPERIELGGRAGLSVALATDWSIFGEYELHRLEASSGQEPSWLHLLSLGIYRRF